MNESKATRYQRYRRRAGVAGLVSGAVMVALVALTPGTRWIAGWAEGFGRGLPGLPHAALSLLLFVLVLVVLWELAVLPAMLYLGLRVDRRYGHHRPAVEDVLAAQAQATLVALPAALAAGTAVRAGFWLAGDWWWAASGGLLAAMLVAALRGAPVVLARLTWVRPVVRPDLVDRLAELSTRAGVPIARVEALQIEETSRLTALVTGIGRSRRVFIAAELARDWSDDEVSVVVAHELAHHAHHDLWRTLALDASVLSLALWVADRVVGALSLTLGLAGARDLAALPLLALVAGVVWLAATPLRHAHSRQLERRADEFALSLTGGADAFSAAIRRLGARHLAEERPSAATRWLYHRHPSITERLALAEAHGKVRSPKPEV